MSENKIVTPEQDAYEAKRMIFEKEAETVANADLGSDPFGGPAWGTEVSMPTPQGIKRVRVALQVQCANPLHRCPRPIMSCQHCIPGQQDEVHPVGIVFMPAGYYLCKTCLKLLERHKLRIENEITLQCSDCVWECVQTLKKKDPALYRNLREEKKLNV